jgi:hypothetical protein
MVDCAQSYVRSIRLHPALVESAYGLKPSKQLRRMSPQLHVLPLTHLYGSSLNTRLKFYDIIRIPRHCTASDTGGTEPLGTEGRLT